MGAPNVYIDLNPSVQGVEDNSLANKDAIYFSGHKFIGGVQTPGLSIVISLFQICNCNLIWFVGILIAKKPIFRRLNTCEPDGFFASSETEKVLNSTS